MPTYHKLTINVSPSDAEVDLSATPKLEAYTNTGTTIDSDYIATKTSGDNTTYIDTNAPAVLFKAIASFEFKTKFKYSSCGTQGSIIAFSSGTATRAFCLQVYGSNKVIRMGLPRGTNNAWVTSSFTPTVDTWYYIKAGMTSAEAYIDISETGWDGTFTRIATYSEPYLDAQMASGNFRLFQAGTQSTSWFNGSIDLKETSMVCNGFEVIKPIKEQPSLGYNGVTTYVGGISNDGLIYYSAGYTYPRLFLSNLPAFNTADSWEFRMRFAWKDVSTEPNYIFANKNDTSSGPIVKITNSTKIISMDIPFTDGTSSSDSSGNYVVNVGEPYCMKFGFDGSKYYLDMSNTGWNGTFTRAAEITSSNKCKLTATGITLFGLGSESDAGSWSTQGNIDLKDLEYDIDDSLAFKATENIGYTENSVVSYTASKTGYNTVTGSVTMDSDKTLNITLTPEGGGGGTNNLHIGATQIKKCCVGTTEVKKIYLGTVLLYEKQ